MGLCSLCVSEVQKDNHIHWFTSLMVAVRAPVRHLRWLRHRGQERVRPEPDHHQLRRHCVHQAAEPGRQPVSVRVCTAVFLETWALDVHADARASRGMSTRLLWIPLHLCTTFAGRTTSSRIARFSGVWACRWEACPLTRASTASATSPLKTSVRSAVLCFLALCHPAADGVLHVDAGSLSV